MTVKKLLTGGAWAALAAALAFPAIPAQAQDRGRDGRPSWTQPRSSAPAEPAKQKAQVEPRRAAPARAERRAERPAQPRSAPAEVRAPQSRADRAGGTLTRGDRNRSYVDPNRNRTYHDGRRDNDRDGRRDGDRDRRDGDRDWRDGRRDNDRDWRDGRRDRDWRDGLRRNDRRWDRRWRDNRSYDWYRYRTYYPSVYRIGRYYSPYRNYSYRRLSIGFFLDSLFYSDRYRINDPWRYRLPEVYGPYRWVRYYDDALLVDIYSGEVVDVIHDFFW